MPDDASKEKPIVEELKYPRDSKRTRIIRDFLNGTMKEFADLNSSICASAGSYPFEYAERQIQSVLFCSFVNIESFPYSEYPIFRKTRGQPKKKGWLDFWVSYRNTVFLIEFKHAWASFNSSRSPLWINKDWKRAIRDVRAISKESLDDERASGSQELFELVMMTIRLEQHPRKGSKPKIIGETEAKQRVTTLYQSLDPEPTWAFYWLLDEELQRRPHQWEGKFWNYPAICLFVWSKEAVH